MTSVVDLQSVRIGLGAVMNLCRSIFWGGWGNRLTCYLILSGIQSVLIKSYYYYLTPCPFASLSDSGKHQSPICSVEGTRKKYEISTCFEEREPSRHLFF